uniref:hypothetical protein n=1 Tax=Agathobacter rectalis TaxID=39491 RepID=UPI004028B896
MELEECIKDGFDDFLRDYIRSEEYVSAKQQEGRCLVYLMIARKMHFMYFWIPQQIRTVCLFRKHICMELWRV